MSDDRQANGTALLPVRGGVIFSVIQRGCDRCTQGVMDRDNPHLYGECTCQCHAAPSHIDLGNER